MRVHVHDHVRVHDRDHVRVHDRVHVHAHLGEGELMVDFGALRD